MLFKSSPKHPDQLLRFKNICAIGGGTGLGRLLDSLSIFPVNVTGIVATSDNGGSTGWIRQQTDSIAWGDIRNCLNQMSPKGCMQSALFQYRFRQFDALESQNLGNLMLYALNELSGRPLDAINHARDILKIKTAVIPMSEQSVHLVAHDHDDVTHFGEIAVDEIPALPNDLWLEPHPVATPEAVQAIEQAELIVLSSGSLLTSLMPNLLLPEILSAITHNPAPVILIANMQPAEDALGSLSLSDQCLWMQNILGENIIDAIIWPRSRERHDCEWIDTLVADVRDKNEPTHHDRDKLMIALNALLAKF